MINQNIKYDIGLLFIICLLLIFFIQNNSFFWDTIQLTSKHAHWYYENQFAHFFLPNDIDSGHPPFMGMYIGGLWLFFGRSLAVAHWAMFPFLFGIVYQLYFIYAHLLKTNALIPTLITLGLPVLAGQSVLISPDLILGFFLLWSVRSILTKKTFGLTIGIIGLSLISMRGMMTASAVFLFYIYLNRVQLNFKLINRSILYFGPGIFLSIAYMIAHYLYTDWIGFHQDSPWSPSFEIVGFKGFIHNIGVVAWRFLDFGLIWIWAIVLFLTYRHRQKLKLDQTFRNLCILFLVTIVCLTPTALFFHSLSAHRYFLPSFIVLVIISLYLIHTYIVKRKKIILCIAFLGLWTGNLWIYPDRISQGWDSTLAHVPYYQLRQKMKTYITDMGIPFNQVGSFFPNISTFKYTDLESGYSFEVTDLQRTRYILYSNVFNVDDATIDYIKDLKVAHRESFGPIYMTLLENNTN